MEAKRMNYPKMLFAGILLGSTVGIFMWVFFKLMNVVIDLIWQDLRNAVTTPFFPLIICLIGGLIIGIAQKLFGEYPKSLEEVMGEYKQNKTLRYDNLHIIALCAFLPLIFGGTIGPEAGLTGIIVGMCCWIGDRMKFVAADSSEFKKIGISATLAIIFASPLYGLVSTSDSDDEISAIKKDRFLMIAAPIIGGILIFSLLTHFFGEVFGIHKFSEISMTKTEYLYFIPLALVGVIAGYCFRLFTKASGAVFGRMKNPIVKALIGGAALGVCGIVLPLSMFSGEVELGVIQTEWQSLTVAVLLLTAIAKLLLTNVCLATGWKGGTIFPIIFSGVSLGYAMALVFPVDPVASVVIVCAALTATIMRKALAVSLLLLLCFPIAAFIPCFLSALVGSYVPLPKALLGHEE